MSKATGFSLLDAGHWRLDNESCINVVFVMCYVLFVL